MTEGALLNDRYQLEEVLGSGGMANVYRARDVVLDRPVAIKVLRKEYSSNENFQKQFWLEARSAANLSHPNIVTVHDFGSADDLLYIVMEHVPGKDLKQLVRERGRFPFEQAIPLLIQACAGVGYAHRAGLVHCDIKPHNMLVSKDMRLKVTDFGIARALARSNLANEMMLCGARHYILLPSKPQENRRHPLPMFTRWGLCCTKSFRAHSFYRRHRRRACALAYFRAPVAAK
jgi:serine/threonine protein kinase